ncbi:hypothetical protein ACQ4PT_047915 [Festuca glaucescens]
MAPSCWLFCAWWLPLMLAVAALEEQAEDCLAKGCGNLTISDPFWLVDSETGRSCGSGSSNFEVVCYNNTPIIRSFGLDGFAIINITYEERSLRATDLGKLNLLNAPNNCDVLPTWNTSAKLRHPFRISNINLDLILYNCTEAVHRNGRGLVETKMGCGNQHKVFARVGGRYNETSDYGGYVVEGCDTCVVPVLGLSSKANGGANASDYERLIHDGFLLTWDPPSLALFLLHHPTTQAACEPSACRNLTVKYPFWLGAPSQSQPEPSCGPPAFELWCTRNGSRSAASMRGSAIHILGIDYGNSSFVASHTRIATGDDGVCRTDFNMSSSLALSPFRIRATNRAPCFLYDCNGTEPQEQSS